MLPLNYGENLLKILTIFHEKKVNLNYLTHLKQWLRIRNLFVPYRYTLKVQLILKLDYGPDSHLHH